eukprot:scaffold7459_cov20-Tisochrysis_lutea.AAC.2
MKHKQEVAAKATLVVITMLASPSCDTDFWGLLLAHHKVTDVAHFGAEKTNQQACAPCPCLYAKLGQPPQQAGTDLPPAGSLAFPPKMPDKQLPKKARQAINNNH